MSTTGRAVRKLGVRKSRVGEALDRAPGRRSSRTRGGTPTSKSTAGIDYRTAGEVSASTAEGRAKVALAKKLMARNAKRGSRPSGVNAPRTSRSSIADVGTAVAKVKARTTSKSAKTSSKPAKTSSRRSAKARTSAVGKAAEKVAARQGISKQAARAKARQIVKKRRA